MPRPDKLDFTDSSVTEGGFKTAMDSLIDWLETTVGSVDEYIKIARGVVSARPAAEDGGWLRWNTDDSVLNMSVGTVWQKVVSSLVDATWQLRFDFDQRYLALFKSIHTGNIATVGIMNNAGDYVEIERTATETIVRSSGTDKVKIVINGVTVFSIDSNGNAISKGNMIANGTP